MKLIYKLAVVTGVAASTFTGLQFVRAQAAERSDKQFIVCIDPGHPSETSAGASAHGLSENTLNWEVAVRLAKKLNNAGIPWVITKTRLHQNVTNRRRAEIANGDNIYKQACAAFIRLHCDEGSGRGWTWYYPDRAGRKGNVTGPPRQVQQWSRSLAWTINDAMKPVLKNQLKTNPIKTDAATFVGGKQGGVLTGSIYSRVPTALIEMCYINQKSDARFIASAQGQDRMAEALLAGIKSWKVAWEKTNPE
jgi:N-acetylmuramoyl-L-alanine amidase